MLGAQAVQGHRGMLQLVQVKEQDMKETQERGMTHFSINQTQEPRPGVTAEQAGEDQPG